MNFLFCFVVISGSFNGTKFIYLGGGWLTGDNTWSEAVELTCLKGNVNPRLFLVRKTFCGDIFYFKKQEQILVVNMSQGEMCRLFEWVNWLHVYAEEGGEGGKNFPLEFNDILLADVTFLLRKQEGCSSIVMFHLRTLSTFLRLLWQGGRLIQKGGCVFVSGVYSISTRGLAHVRGDGVTSGGACRSGQATAWDESAAGWHPRWERADLLLLTAFPSPFIYTRSNRDQNSSLHFAHSFYLSKVWTEMAVVGLKMFTVCVHSVSVVCL